MCAPAVQVHGVVAAAGGAVVDDARRRDALAAQHPQPPRLRAVHQPVPLQT